MLLILNEIYKVMLALLVFSYSLLVLTITTATTKLNIQKMSPEIKEACHVSNGRADVDISL